MDSAEHIRFRSRLREAAHWCRLRLRVDDPAGSLRTKSLLPALVVLEEENDGWWNNAVPDPGAEVNELCRKRKRMAEAEGLVLGDENALPVGRILLFYPLESLCDGAAWQSSNGFFDNWNIPPWDTWFWYSGSPEGRHVLYTWVPSEFVDLASVGVSVNPEECLEWLDDVSPELSASLT